MLSLHYHEFMGKIEECKAKKQLVVDDHMLDKVLDEIKEIVGIEKFDDTNILTALDDITLKNVVT